jgi:hypothetical protein
MPTKERRLKKAKEHEQRRLDESFGPAPEYLVCDDSSINDELGTGDRYPAGLFETDNNGDVCLRATTGTGGNRARKEDKETRIEDLRRKNASAWGKRTAAKTLDTSAYDEVSVRTIQRYFKETK